MHKNEVFTSQPQGNFDIDWGNPITKGLVMAWTPGRTTALSGSIHSYASPAVNTYFGRGYTPLGVSSVIGAPIVDGITDQVTLVVQIVKLNTNGGSISNNGGLSNNYLGFTLGGAGTTRVVFSLGDANSLSGVTPAPEIYSGLWICTAGPRGMEIYRNGQLWASKGTFSPKLRVTNEVIGFGIGLYTADSSASYSLIGLFKRQIERHEVSLISRNPWQIFRRFSRPLFTPTGESGVLIPDLTSPGVIDITANTAKPELNVQY